MGRHSKRKAQSLGAAQKSVSDRAATSETKREDYEAGVQRSLDAFIERKELW
jgi:hypothetical protein